MTEKLPTPVSAERRKHREEGLPVLISDCEANQQGLHAANPFCLLNTMSELIHQANVEAGWWTDLETNQPKARNQGELLMLVVTEIAEAMEGVRKDIQDDHLPNRKMLDVELADALIRIFDFIGGYDIDIAGALREKFLYNQSRADHKIENRKAAGGKKV